MTMMNVKRRDTAAVTTSATTLQGPIPAPAGMGGFLMAVEDVALI
jgi:hypothetical protein